MKFCENFGKSRISADKRFLMYFHYIPLRLTPDRGFCVAVCKRKITNIFCNSLSNQPKNILIILIMKRCW